MLRTALRTVLVLLLIADPTALSGADLFPTFQTFAEKAGYRRIDLRKVRNHFYVEPVIEGKKVPLVLDTGAAVSVMDERVLGMLETRRPGPGDGAPRTMSLNGREATLRIVPSLLFGDLKLLDGVFASADLEHFWKFEQSEFTKVFGLLGMPELEGMNAWISYPNQCLYIRPGPDGASAESLRTLLRSTGYTAVPLEFEKNHLYVIINVRGVRSRVVLDTGASHTFIDLGFARRTKLPLRKVDGLMTGTRGEVWEIAAIEASHFFLGDALVRDKALVVHSLGALLGGADMFGRELPGMDGLLGGDMLFYCNAFIDIDGRTLYVKPRGS